ncbi:MAG TPA: hypothetical protein VG122_03030, partial [Gemmata sp.]|nr:hypothetical protein [Gemmata sp.]
WQERHAHADSSRSGPGLALRQTWLLLGLSKEDISIELSPDISNVVQHTNSGIQWHTQEQTCELINHAYSRLGPHAAACLRVLLNLLSEKMTKEGGIKS